MLSTTLNNAMPVQDVLRECGTSVQRIPGICRCPSCNNPTLYVTHAGDEAGGWYQCQHCKFVGDSLDLLARRAGHADAATYIRGRILSNPDLYSPENLEAHKNEMKAREALKEAWRQISTPSLAFVNPPPEVKDLMTWAGMKDTVDMASSLTEDIRDARFGACANVRARELLPTGGQPFPGTAHQPWIVTPIYAAPGLIAGLAAFSDRSTLPEYYFLHNADRDGLLFLDRPIGGSTDILFAFGSVHHAAKLHFSRQLSHGVGQPPIVCYTPHTATAWRHVQARKIVFWAPELTIDVLVQARQLGDRAYIARWMPNPALGPTPADHFRGETHGQTLHRLATIARPWLQVLKDYVVDNARSAVADNIPIQLRLTPTELDKLRAYCSTQEDQRLFDSVYDTGHIDLSVRTPDNRTVVQKASGWYKVMPNGSHVLATSAMPVVEQISFARVASGRGAPLDTELISGFIRVGAEDPAKQTVVPFKNIPRATLTHSWISAQCTKAGHQVTVHDNKPAWYWAVATLFHRPVVVNSLGSIGWDTDTGAFRFANCTIAANGALDTSPVMTAETHPSDRFSGRVPVQESLVKEWFQDGRYANFWRVWLGGLYNMLAPAVGRQPLTIGVYNTDGTDVVAEVAAALYGETCANAQQAKNTAERHGVPAWVPRADGSALPAELLRTPGLTNVIVDLKTEENAHMAKLLGWHVVICDGPVEVPQGAEMLLAAALVRHQRDSANPDLPPFRLALETVRAWLMEAFEQRAPGLNGILKAVAQPDTTAAGRGRRLLGIIKLLLDAEVLIRRADGGVLTDILPSKMYVIQRGDTVCVPVEGLTRAIKDNRLPYDIPAGAAEELDAAGALSGVFSTLGEIVGWRIPAALLPAKRQNG